VRGDDKLLNLVAAATTDYLLCLTSLGRVASVRVARIPETTRAGKSELVRSFLSLDPGERVVAIVPVGAFSEEVYIVVFTRDGKVKKSALSEYVRTDEKGSPDVRLLGSDAIVRALISPGGGDYLVTTSDGKTLRFADADLRAAGRVGQGVQAIGLARDAGVVGADWVGEQDGRALWVASSSGLVKRSPVSEYPRKGRATGGVATMQLAGATLVGAAVLGMDEDALLISSTGRTARAVPDRVALVARDRKGITGLKLEASETLTRLVVLPA
jgi:DNA gyrase subunit A